MAVKDRTQDINLGALAIHINVMRVMWATVLPKIAQIAPNPRDWLSEVQDTAMLATDYTAFPQAFHIDPDMMKAAVAGSIEEMFAGALAVLTTQESD
ncbi:hypothetical protein HGI47_17475 [Novosphingobium sp. ERN07]|uniref:hypothetical protein n=1 Tax=Novosphingobium sp. ERN07 TaxID=2726187 RepID=UPI00145757E3|nr:hypothetical protein [Novosphingobium sp. ERN07]NLR72669.1 hypothetical protein [Novosphingobium sp. ERN07]